MDDPWEMIAEKDKIISALQQEINLLRKEIEILEKRQTIMLSLYHAHSNA